MWAESSPIGVMTEVTFFSEVQVEKASHRGKFVSLQVNLYFLIMMDKLLLWELSISTVNAAGKKFKF